ncbi:beta-glucosidase [Fusibacter bizertensis]
MSIYDEALEIVNLMTLDEKAKVCVGKNFWEIEGVARLGVKAIKVADGPHGLRKQSDGKDHLGINESIPATCFPTASLLASTWNRNLIQRMGNALAKECINENVSILLGPGVNIKRSPLGGRNFEYFSEDPYLSSEIAIAWINGVQMLGVGASLKHFAVNNQEYRRMIINAVVDERTLRELYLSSFEEVVKQAKPATVMCAYNRLNGEYCSENEKLLTDILREEWSYEGVLITDWGATNDRVKGLAAGQDVEMPGINGENSQKIIHAVKCGILSMEQLDKAVVRIIMMLLEKNKHSSENSDSDGQSFTNEHHQLAKEIASEGIVLLKNEGILPLSRNDKIAIIGNMAEHPRFQGSGSSFMNPTKLDTVYDCLKDQIEHSKTIVYCQGYLDDGIIHQRLIDEAILASSNADKVVIFAGLSERYESEGFDRLNLKLPPTHEKLIEEILKVNQKIVVVLSNGAPVSMPWKDSVSAILEGYLSGQAGASAMVDIIFGDINPSGKIAETFPESDALPPYFTKTKASALYKEGLYVGYRYFDRYAGKVAFPFGHGLSYTTFDLSEPKVTVQMKDSKFNGCTAFVKVNNIGQQTGKTVVQAYVSALDSICHRPLKVLGQFDKIELEVGMLKEIKLELPKSAFSVYNTKTNRWHVEPGVYEVRLGFSSVDLPVSLKVVIEETQSDGKLEMTKADQFYKQAYGKSLQIDDNQYFALYDLRVQEMNAVEIKTFDLNTPIFEMRKTFIGSILMQIIKIGVKINMKKQNNEGMKNMVKSIVEEMTLRNLVMMSGGIVTHKMTEAFLTMAKGQYFKGLGQLMKKSSY